MMSARRSLAIALAIALGGAACGPPGEGGPAAGGAGGAGAEGGTGGAGGAGGAGGSSATCDGGGKNADGVIDVQGAVVFHSMNKLASMNSGQAIDYSGLVVEVVDPSGLSGGAPSAPLAEASLSGPACESPSAGSCTFCFGDTNIAGAAAGLAVTVRDSRTSDPLWITAVRGVASSDDLAELQSAGAPLDAANPFAVTRDALDTVVASITGLSGDELMKRGVLFGLIYSSPASAGQGTPLAGATVQPSSADMIIVYPNSMFSGAASATANQGAFLAIPSAPGAASTVTFTVTPPAGDTHTWDATQLGRVIPGAMYFHVMYAAE